jgi:HK97 family phage major capsid protein
MTIRELKENRSKLLLEAQAILLANPDAEKRTSAHKMIADADALEADITALEKVEVEQRSATMPNRPNPEAAKTEDKTTAEKRAFENYVRYGIVSPELRSNFETRDGLVTTSAGAGGQFVPQGFYPLLTEAMKFYGNVLNVVKQIEVDNGAPTKYATVNDTGNLLSVVGEIVTVDEVDPNSISGSIISSDFLTTGVIKVSLAELGDSAFNLDEWIKNAFGKRYYRGLSQMVTAGSSSGNVGSLVTAATTGATLSDPTKIQWSDVVALYAALDPAYDADAKWTMNANTRGVLLATTDTLGRPLYIPAPTADTFDMVLGKPVVINPFLDNFTQGVADKFSIIYGDHSAYLLRNVKPGLSIMRLNERYMDQGAVGFIGFARAGGALLDAGTHPILKLKTAHS